ncbi:hypothetical protein Bca101_034047 [Brassica carinata]
MGLDSPRGGFQWRRLVVSFGSPLRNLCTGGVALLPPVFPPCASCRVYTVTEGGFVGGNLQVFLSYDDIVGWCRNLVSPVVEAVGTVHPRFEGAFLSGSWQPSGLPAPFPSSWSEPASFSVVALTSALASPEFIYLYVA